MAQLPWYNGIRITDLTLVPAVPGQIVHEIPSTGAARVFNAGVGRWEGSIQFGRVEDPDVGLRTEAFISGLNGSSNTTDIPLRLIKNLQTADSTLKEAQIGRYYNYGNRLILIHGRVGGKTLIFPEIDINEDSALTSPTRLRIRLSGSQSALPHQPMNFGPWALSFFESI